MAHAKRLKPTLMGYFFAVPIGYTPIAHIYHVPDAVPRPGQQPQLLPGDPQLFPHVHHHGQVLVLPPINRLPHRRLPPPGDDEVGVIEPADAPLPLPVNGQDGPLARLDGLLPPPPDAQGLDGMLQDLFGRGVQVHPHVRAPPDGQRVVPPDEVHRVLLVQYRKRKVSLQHLRHPAEAVGGHFLLPLDELHRDVAVRLYGGRGEFIAPPQLQVIEDHPVVGQGEAAVPGLPGKGVVVLIPPDAALGGHPGVAHELPDLLRDAVLHPPCRPVGLLDAELPLVEEGDTRGVCAPDLGGLPQLPDDLPPLGCCELALVVQQSENRAHFSHTSSETWTGSLT